MKERQTVSPSSIHLQWFGEDTSGTGQSEGAQGAGSLATELARSAGSGSDPASQAGAQGQTDPAKTEGTEEATTEIAGFWNAATKGLREDPRFKTFAPKYKSFDDVVKSAMELGEKLGSRIPIPTDKSTPEEIAEYYKKSGVPSTPEEYKLDRDPKMKYDDTAEKEFRKQMHDLHVPQPVAASIYKNLNERAAKELQAYGERQTAARAATTQALQKKWGNDFKGNNDTAVRGLKAYASDALLQAAEETGMGNRAEFIELFYELGKSVREDAALGKGDASASLGAQQKKFKYPGVKS
jgi:hypothetical protein